jgi:two-component system, sensor histidine kinase and response regulator
MDAIYKIENPFLQQLAANPAKILLVDDREENLISLESLLRNDDEPIAYLFARSGDEALKIALKEELALILLDVQMPGMNGYEVARYLRNYSKTKTIPIIFVTAIGHETSYMVEGFEAGAVDFLFKPLHPFITKAKVSSFIKIYVQKKELEKANQFMLDVNRELEERVKERTKELTRINNDLDNFIYTASHDLKAPINNIEGLMHVFYKQLSEDIKNSEAIAPIKAMINESISRFKNTLQDLTDIAKIQNEVSNDTSKVSFKETLEEVKATIADQIKEFDAEIIDNFTEVSEVCFSRKNLRSIIYNLLSNAIKYHSPDRTPLITISSTHKDENIILTITDNGLGMTEEGRKKIFEMFKRLHNHVEGSGVGLYMVKKIVDNADGKIEVESRLKEGSTFKIYFKAKPA